MKVQIVGFEGYDNDLGGVTATVIVNGEKHTIAIQCCVTEDGEYAENDHDNPEDNRWFIDGFDMENAKELDVYPNPACHKMWKKLLEEFGTLENITNLICAVNDEIIHWEYAPDITTETIDVYSNVERRYMNPFDMVYTYNIEKVSDDDFKINKEKEACEDYIYCSHSDGSEYRVPMKKIIEEYHNEIMGVLYEKETEKSYKQTAAIGWFVDVEFVDVEKED